MQGLGRRKMCVQGSPHPERSNLLHMLWRGKKQLVVRSIKDAASFFRGGHPMLWRWTWCRSCAYQYEEWVQNVKTLSEPFRFVKCGSRACECPAVTQRSAGVSGVCPLPPGTTAGGLFPSNGNRCLNAHCRLGFISALTLDSASLPLSGLAGKSRAPAAYIACFWWVMQPLAPAITPCSCRHPSLLLSPLAPAVTPHCCCHPSPARLQCESTELVPQWASCAWACHQPAWETPNTSPAPGRKATIILFTNF